MELYEAPVKEFDTVEHTIRKTKQAGRTATQVINTWKKGFETFWETPRTQPEAAMTREQWQAMFDADPLRFINILSDSAKLRDLIVVTYAEHIGTSDRDKMTQEQDEASLLPSRYLVTPYPLDFTSEPGKILITGDIVKEWQKQ